MVNIKIVADPAIVQKQSSWDRLHSAPADRRPAARLGSGPACHLLVGPTGWARVRSQSDSNSRVSQCRTACPNSLPIGMRAFKRAFEDTRAIAWREAWLARPRPGLGSGSPCRLLLTPTGLVTRLLGCRASQFLRCAIMVPTGFPGSQPFRRREPVGFRLERSCRPDQDRS